MARANFSQHSNEGKNGMSAPRNVVRPNGVAVPLDAPSQNEVNRWIQKRQWWRMAKLRDAWAPWLRMLQPVAPKRAYLLVRRHCKRLRDEGNVQGGFKHVLDMFRTPKVGDKHERLSLIVDDSPTWLVDKYEQVRDLKPGQTNWTEIILEPFAGQGEDSDAAAELAKVRAALGDAVAWIRRWIRLGHGIGCTCQACPDMRSKLDGCGVLAGSGVEGTNERN